MITKDAEVDSAEKGVRIGGGIMINWKISLDLSFGKLNEAVKESGLTP